MTFQSGIPFAPTLEDRFSAERGRAFFAARKEVSLASFIGDDERVDHANDWLTRMMCAIDPMPAKTPVQQIAKLAVQIHEFAIEHFPAGDCSWVDALLGKLEALHFEASQPLCRHPGPQKEVV